MRIQQLLAIALLAVPLFAVHASAGEAPKDAPKETLEATVTRVRELEKANVVLQEDLARARLQLDLTREALAKTRADLDAEAAARKALDARLADTQQQATRDTASSGEAVKSLSDATNGKLAELDKAIAALWARQQSDLAALKQQYEVRLASLQEALDKESAARLGLEKTAALQITNLESKQKRDRTWAWALSGLNLGFTLSR